MILSVRANFRGPVDDATKRTIARCRLAVVMPHVAITKAVTLVCLECVSFVAHNYDSNILTTFRYFTGNVHR